MNSIYSTKFSRVSRAMSIKLEPALPYITASAGFLVTMIALQALHPGFASAQMCGGPSGSCSPAGYEPELVEHAVGSLFLLIEGAFGALVMVISGIGAIIAAAMGAYRAAVGMLVVAVGSFILRALVSLFFGSGYMPYSADQ